MQYQKLKKKQTILLWFWFRFQFFSRPPHLNPIAFVVQVFGLVFGLTRESELCTQEEIGEGSSHAEYPLGSLDKINSIPHQPREEFLAYRKVSKEGLATPTKISKAACRESRLRFLLYDYHIATGRTVVTNAVNVGVEMEMEMEMDDDHDGMEFCGGMPMTMSMGGFQSALFSKGSRPADCIVFLFTGWKLDRPGKYVAAMICTFVMAVAIEGIAHGQTHVRGYCLAGASNGKRKAVMSLIYGLQQLLGWMLMLISMTFSVELFASVVVGLFVGKLLFPTDPLVSRPRLARRSSDPSGGANDNDNFNDNETDGLLQREGPPPQSSSPPSSDESSGSNVRRRRR